MKKFMRAVMVLFAIFMLTGNQADAAKFVQRTGTVNTNLLNVRKSPSYDGKILKTLKSGKSVTITGQVTSGGMKWYKISIKVSGKKKKAYVLKRYVKLDKTTVKSTMKQKAVMVKKATAYKTANTKDTKVATIKKKSIVKIRGEIKVAGVNWYKINYTNNGKKIVGYVKQQYVNSSSGNAAAGADGQSIQAYLSQFPESYQKSLQALHEKYPNWMFIPQDTGLTWEEAVKGENVVGRNTISSTVPKGGQTGTFSAPFSYLSTMTGAYDWSSDTYKLCDGTTWYTVSEDVLKYYMDPRNFLTEKNIFQFENLSFDDAQDEAVVKSMLSGTFMKGDYEVTDKTTKKTVKGSYSQAFMAAGRENAINPYFLAARVIQEVGVNGSGSTSGTVKGYKGIYNFYNIGANDSAGGGAVENGLLWASGGKDKSKTYLRPWTTPYKSIVGGAGYIAKNYVQKGQNTLYTQKFNVVSKDSLYDHQYMTCVYAPANESPTVYNAYKKYNILDSKMIFRIPVYKNMPAKACALPKAEGNPNSYVKSVSITNTENKASLKGYLNKKFKYTKKNYEMTVPLAVKKIKIGGTPVSGQATITSGAGTYSLTAGKTKTVKLVCTAGNGTSRTYKFKITRLAQ